MKGRKRTPDQVKVLKGTFRPGRAGRPRPSPSAPTGAAAPPEPPETLTPEERAVWDRVVAIVPAGVLERSDAYMLELFARCYAEFLALDADVKVSGRLVFFRDDKGKVIGVRANPNYKHRLALVPELRRLGEQLGLTPSTRQKLTGGGEAPKDPFGDLMSRGGILGARA